jgi:L-threonylcarbamoyladenylate synthase
MNLKKQMKRKVIKINPRDPEEDKIASAASLIKAGGLVIFPTDTVYGLGADALNTETVKRVYRVKRRPQDKPLIIQVADIEQVHDLAAGVPQEASTLMEKFWPGALTLVFNQKSSSKTIALRMPDNKIALSLIRKAGVPLTSPSANLSGEPSPSRVEEISEELIKEVDLVIDGGETKIGIESTILDLTTFPPQVLREGAILSSEIKSFLDKLRKNKYNES